MGIQKVFVVVVATAVFAISGCIPKKNTVTSTPVVSAPVWGDDSYANAIKAWKLDDHQNAARFFQSAYGDDDARAEAMLGVLYVKGAGVFRSAEVARGYAIAADQQPTFDAFKFYHAQWQTAQDADLAYLIAWVLANRFSGQAKQDYKEWIIRAAEAGHAEARWEVTTYLN